MKSGLRSLQDYLSLVKFSHTVFAMPFALIGFTLAVTMTEHSFSLRLLLLVILCMIFARNAAMGFNRIADRKYDALNPRTSRREIPAGTIKAEAATIFVLANCILFILSAFFINKLTFFLSPVALFVVLGYSFTKRFTSLSHFVLGLGLSLAPVGAYISVTGAFNILPVIYSFIVLTWVSGFDIIYALQDDEFDRANLLHSIPSATGRKKAIVISSLVHIITFILILVAGIKGDGGILFWIGTAIFSLLLLYQHLIVKPSDISRVNLAFATTNGIGSIVFALFSITDLVTRYW
ncbi:MAG TPA: UbiA-like polyprenyltransferase [Bacteroidales bacterium]|nr:UbiA-like polyprenyltransferase [Bacteroidales bacterium]